MSSYRLSEQTRRQLEDIAAVQGVSRTDALAQAVAVDLPLLRDSTRYTFHTRTELRSNGQKANWYEYMITTDYKDSMIRAEYLEKKPHRA